ncbi:speract receptor [Chironomus tepperi]|uniref:speract receptor n=1 Tax=Chironomus tepperi TaxID=113505 RepID=UPI00391F7B98
MKWNFLTINQKFVLLFLFKCFIFSYISFINCDVYKLGYITGSHRRPGDLEYERPGLTISGALTLAIEEVNKEKLAKLNHSIEFIVAETYGEEISSIRETASLWKQGIFGYIGPQETCIHEGRMAAAFNLPMISYFCTSYETSNKKDFATFARTRPPDTQIAKSVVSLLLAYNWTQVTFLHVDHELSAIAPIAKTVINTLNIAGIKINAIRTWNEDYYHGYRINPFDDLVQDTYRDTRIYLILGQFHEHIGLMLSLYNRGLLNNGEYFVIGMDIEQYDTSDPEKYLKGILHSEQEPWVGEAYLSYFAVFPSPTIGFDKFSVKVNKFLELPPFEHPNPLKPFNKAKQIRAEAAYLYDAVHLYADALVNCLESNRDPKNGTDIINAIKGRSYQSAMGFLVHIDENGDAGGNYTILGMKKVNNGKTNHSSYGLYPIGTFITRTNQSDSFGKSSYPDLQLFGPIPWVGGKPPVDEPACGYRGEKCISYAKEITAAIAGIILLILTIVSLVLYRNWRYEQELDSLLWKIDFREIQMHENDTSGTTKQTRATHPLIRTSQVSLSSNPDADFRYSTIFTPIGLYKGQLYAIKKIRKKSVDITREMKMELKILRDIRHDNLNAFIGACTEPPNICIITEYCSRGSLKDVLENDDVKLDNMFIASLVFDLIRGMTYLHDSPLKVHGNLCTSNCLIDSRWVVKLSDFGLYAFKKGSNSGNHHNHHNYDGGNNNLNDNNELYDEDMMIPVRRGSTDSRKFIVKYEKLLYKAPELLREITNYNDILILGSQKGDIYSFAIILYEIHTRNGPFGEIDCTYFDCLKRLTVPVDITNPFRPSLQPLETSFDCVRECIRECWAENAESRPDFKTIRTKLRALRKGMRPNIFDNMMAMMEKYANNLEQLVDERTDQLQEEKKKTEALLLEMLPRPVAEQLKRGNKVEAESYDMVTIYFSDIVGFTTMSAESTPLQVVDFLNDLYTCFDSIIGNYDVYKVETIGDAYMVCSGLPIRNGDIHAGEIASMSLHLLEAIREFKIRHRPDDNLMLRIGIHSGPVCAGVVGLKMPRYCLFGDTVNTSSRMESTGEALKIHCSGECKKLLDTLGGYLFEDRGKIPVKGKGEMNTYWLTGEVEEYKVKRYQARTDRRASKNSAKQISKFLQAQKELQKSSLKSAKSLVPSPNRLAPFNNNLMRSTSFDSPKKLRFATDILLENHQYCSNKYLRYSNDALREVISDQMTATPLPQTSNDSLIFAVVDANDKPKSLDDDDVTASCPCINKEITEFICNGEDFFDEIHIDDDETAELNDLILMRNLENAPSIKITSITPLLSQN